MPTKEHLMGVPDLEAIIQISLVNSDLPREDAPSVFQLNTASHSSSKL